MFTKSNSKATKAKAASHTIPKQIEQIKVKLSELDDILRKCWQTDQGLKLTITNPKGVLRASVSPFDAAACSVHSYLKFAEKPVEALVYSIRLSEKSKSEMAAKTIEDGYKRMVEVLQLSIAGRGRSELLQLQNSVKKFITCLDTTQDYFAETPRDSDTEKQGRSKGYDATEIILNKYPEFKKEKLKKGELDSLSEHVNKLLKSWGQKPVKKESVKNIKSKILKIQAEARKKQ